MAALDVVTAVLKGSALPTPAHDIGPVPDTPPELNRFLVSVREALQELAGNRGDNRNSAVRWGDLIANGIVDQGFNPTFAVGIPNIGGAYTSGSGSGGTVTPDLTPPPTLTGLSAVSGLTTVIVQWTGATYTQGHGPKGVNLYAVKKDPADATMPTFPGTSGLVGFAPHALTIYDLSGDTNTRWHLWAKFVTNDGVESTSPAGGTNGVVVTTGQDPSALLILLTNKITRSQLYSDIGTPIDLVTAPATTAGSVAAKVKTETDNRVSAIAQEVIDRNAADATTLSNAQTYVASYAYTKSTVDANIAASASTLTTNYTAADGATLSSAQSYTQTWAYSKTQADSAIAASASTIATNYAAADATTLASANAYTYSRSTIDSAIASSASTLTTNFTTADAATLASAQAYTYSRSAIDGAFTSQSTTLTSAYQAADGTVLSDAQSYTNAYAYSYSDGSALAGSVSTLTTKINSPTTGNNPTYAALQTEVSTRASQTGDLYSQFTVKIDTNGYVSGFGLASTSTGAAPTSSFVVRADSFAIGAPSGPGITPAVPFVVRTTVTTENGTSVPVGVYMDSAYIVNVTALYARFGTLIADSIAAGAISASHLTLGDGTIGGPLKSASYTAGSGSTAGTGWLLQPDGTCRASNVVLWGTIYASAGQIGGITINSDSITSPGYTPGSTGFRIGNDGLIRAFANGGDRVLNMNAAGGGSVLKVGNLLDLRADGTGIFGGTLRVSGNGLEVYNSGGQRVIALGIF